MTPAIPDAPPPLVSVVVPAYNAASTLHATLASACAQTHARLEILVADDGSTDATREIVEGLASRDPRVRLLSGTHSGHPGAVRNRALREVRGEFVAFLDADDLWVKTKISDQLAALRRVPRANFSFTSTRLIAAGADPGPLDRPGPSEIAHPGLLALEHQGERGFELLLTRRRAIHTSSLMVARELAARIGPFSEDPRLRSAQDDDYILRVWRAGTPAPLPEVYVCALRHPSSVSAGNSWENIFALLEAAGAREHLSAGLKRRAWSAAWVVRGERELAKPDSAWRSPFARAWALDPLNPRRIPGLLVLVMPRRLARAFYGALRRRGIPYGF